MPHAITITGTRSTGHRPLAEYERLFAEYLGPWAASGPRWYIGGAVGIDTLTLRWLAERTTCPITVVVPVTLDAQPAEAQAAVAAARAAGRLEALVELRHPAGLCAASYHARNRWMVDRSQFVIGFPHSASDAGSGTWYTLDYGAGRGLPRLIIPV
ncbi:hypothetical protein LI90_4269 [Carbonactinospora thermoautotrophica]|uniref:DNA recombination-mediator protein A n=1 Tax=Carbonactinospora thermoautotrophica TaxID=1469144 RepID=A0A132MZ92_9ACTN|nr:hypothetical protein [Carbonactinospora thermoautotrophica]KWX03218.1 hypothetical protein LI90_4269 [Carbonactinospora thermoautotrophica]